ncbi:MAG: PKD domain-containing protein [Bacteroidales bacterium]|nr:PKD domain-containing protein [Bacteroidales bacterium]
MKNLKRLGQFLIVGILATSLFSSCEEDDPKVLPESSFTFSPTTIAVGDVITFTNTTTNGETYLWDFGDTNTSTDENPTHTFTADGSYTVTLTATNADGEDVASETIVVGALPVSAFTFSPATIVVGDEITFTNTTTDGDTYLWDFGDGNTSTEENPTHIFTEDDSYTVTLTATNAFGENVATEIITVGSHSNVYTIDGTEYDITEAFEYVSAMTGAKHWRMLGEAFPGAVGDAPVNLLKFLPSLGTGALEGTYTFDDAGDETVGTFTYEMTENYAGMSWDYLDQGLTGATLTFTELVTDLWKITLVSGTLAQGDYNAEWTWVATGTEFVYSVDYVGEITAAK